MNSQFTPSGFKKSFGCCGHHQVCEMGQKPCVYRDKDPITMKSCRTYQRGLKESKQPTSNKDVEQISLFD